MPLNVVEELIQAARERGEFDNLPGRGKPLDHSAYFSQPEEVRVAQHLLRNSGFVPPEVELMREIGELQTQLAACGVADERRRLSAQIERARVKLDLMKRAAR